MPSLIEEAPQCTGPHGLSYMVTGVSKRVVGGAGRRTLPADPCSSFFGWLWFSSWGVSVPLWNSLKNRIRYAFWGLIPSWHSNWTLWIYIYIHTYIHICTSIYIYTYYIQRYVYLYMYTCIHMYVYIYICIHTYVWCVFSICESGLVNLVLGSTLFLNISIQRLYPASRGAVGGLRDS